MRKIFISIFILSAILSFQAFAVNQTVTNCADSGIGSLRQAVLDATDPNDEIIFDITTTEAGYSTGEVGPGLVTNEAGGNKWFRIVLITALETFADDGIRVRGSTQTREAANTLGPSVEVRAIGSIVVFEANDSRDNITIEGLVINRLGINNGTAIDLGGADNCHIYGNYIGTTASGEGVTANKFAYNIMMSSDAQNNIIGGNIPSQRNVISWGYNACIWIAGASSINNRIIGNYIGIDRTGTVSLTDSGCSWGVYLTGNANNNQIGGAAAGEGNVIGGFGEAGVRIKDSGTNSNEVYGNYIGTNASGTGDLPGSGAIGNNGLYISDTAMYNQIGGSAAGQGNVISGNTNAGVRIVGANYNLIQGNYIGLDVSGEVDLGNDDDGVNISASALYNYVGGAATGEGNVISGNGQDGSGDGINIVSTCNSNEVLGNYIGTDKDGTTKIANAGDGVYIVSGFNTIGDGTAGGRNIISGNDEYGVSINGTNANSNEVLGNYIGVAVNGTAAVGNNWAGVDISAGSQYNKIGNGTTGGRNIISGNTQYGVRISSSNSNEVLGNYIGTDVNGTVALGNGSAATYIRTGAMYNKIGNGTTGGRNIISGNNQAGVYIRDSGTNSNEVKGNYIGLQVDGTTNCSNGNRGVHIFDGPQYNKIGGSTSFEANIISGNTRHGVDIDNANSNEVTGNYIGVDINSADKGNTWHGVYLQGGSSYNQIGGSSTGEGNVISGNDYSGVCIIGSTTGTNEVLGNYIGLGDDGTTDVGNTLNGVQISDEAKYTKIGNGTAGGRNIISGNDESGVEIRDSGTNSNEVMGNFIGTDITGTVDLGNTTHGIFFDEGPDYNKVGDGTANGLNLISGNGGDGINVDSSDNNKIKGNVIGTDINLTTALPNAGDGIQINQGKYNTIGGTGGDGNLISGNGECGVFISASGANTNEVSANFIGTSNDGTTDVGNTQYGVYISSTASYNQIGRSNVIAFNGGASFPAGILVSGSGTDHNYITYNSIFGNYGQGIKLAAGANEGIATPEVLSANLNELTGLTQVTGESAPAGATIEVYKAESGQGKTYVTSTLANGSGQFSFTASGLVSGETIVVTASTTNPSTSEFSPPFAVFASLALQYQPDNMIATIEAGTDYVGEGIFNTTGLNQTRTRSISTDASATYYVKIKNAGNTTYEVTVTGTTSNSSWDVAYYDAKTSGNNITGQVIGSGWTSAALASEETKEIRLVVTSTGTDLSTFEALITSTATPDGTKQDAVKASTTAVPPTDLSSFDVNAPSTAVAGTSFSVTITAKDSTGGTETIIVGSTALSVDSGTVTPASIESSAFSSGVWTGNVTLSAPGSRTITVTNGSAQGTDTITITCASKEYSATDLGIPGMSISIPAGAASQEVNLSAAVVTSPGDAPAGYSINGTIVDITGTPTTFLIPITVTIAVSGSIADARVYYWNGTAWSNDGITIVSVTATEITFTTTHLTIFAPMAALASNLVRFGPNPYNANSTTPAKIWYWLSADAATSIYIVDMKGTLIWKNTYAAGTNGGKVDANSIDFDGKDRWGNTLGNGVYIYKIVQGGKSIGGGRIAIIK